MSVCSNGQNGVRLDRLAKATLGESSIRFEARRVRSDSDNGYGILAERGVPNPKRITLLNNFLSGNRGKLVRGRSDANVGNFDQTIDPTGSQPP